jgi:hypothetical protein
MNVIGQIWRQPIFMSAPNKDLLRTKIDPETGSRDYESDQASYALPGRRGGEPTGNL